MILYASFGKACPPDPKVIDSCASCAETEAADEVKRPHKPAANSWRRDSETTRGRDFLRH